MLMKNLYSNYYSIYGVPNTLNLIRFLNTLKSFLHSLIGPLSLLEDVLCVEGQCLCQHRIQADVTLSTRAGRIHGIQQRRHV